MSFLRRLIERAKPEDRYSYGPGWDAINAALEPFYPETIPTNWRPATLWRMGGTDPLEAIRANRADGPPPHWHYISFGLSELYRKKSRDRRASGWGMELTFRLRREVTDDQAPFWAVGMLQYLARSIFESGRVLIPGDRVHPYGPINLDEATEIRAVAFALDPQLGRIATPNGSVAFVQVVGLTLDEYAATVSWDPAGFLDLIREGDPLFVTDLARGSYLTDPVIAEIVRARTAAEGSSMGHVFGDPVAWERENGRLIVTLGAGVIEWLHRMIEGRLMYGRVLSIFGPDASVVFEPATTLAWHDAGDGMVLIDLPVPLGRRILSAVPPIAGSYDIDDALRIVVEQSVVKDPDGNEVDVIG